MTPDIYTDKRQNASFPLAAIIVFISSLALASAYLWMAANQQAEAETRQLGHSMARQATFLIRPLILANDHISTNYLLNELEGESYVSGLELIGPHEEVLARAGTAQGPSIQRTMIQDEKNLGTLTLWLNPAPLQQILHRQLLLAMLFSLLAATLTMIALWYRNRRSSATSNAQTADTTDTPSTGVMTEGHPDDTRVAEEHSEAPFLAANSAYTAEDVSTPTDTLADNTLAEFNTADTETDDVSLVRPDAADPDITTPSEAPAPQSEAQPGDADPLLRSVPERIETPETTAIEPAAHSKVTPIRKSASNEEQLGLYSFEQEMELVLASEDAAYLLYIDTNTAHTEYDNADEKQALLHNYHQLAYQVAHIYSGKLELLANGDIQILFDDADDKDNHGINALCSGLLFVHLYRGFNQQRIGQFRPVLNFHTALVRGHKAKSNILQEESRFLTRTTQSNELISHTALTEAPELKRKLLKDADIRREDEDKVLIHRIGKRYQTMFEKQSNHLLTKLRQASTDDQ